MDKKRVVVRADRVAYQRIDEGAVLLHLDTGAYYRVNSVGALVWEALGDNEALEDVIDAVRRSLDEPAPDSLFSDVEDFLNELLERRLVVVRER